jgi:hypothetical protein
MIIYVVDYLNVCRQGDRMSVVYLLMTGRPYSNSDPLVTAKDGQLRSCVA